MGDTEKSVVIVTGGASGIGLGLAHAFGARGSTVVLADLDETALTSAVSELEQADIEAVAHPVDLRDAAGVTELVDHAAGLGRLTAACLNAGVTSTGTNVWETPVETQQFVMDINVGGLANSLRSVVPVLIEQGTEADIVVTASMAGMVTSAGSGAYSASKAAAIALTKALRAELVDAAPFLRVALLNPGMVKTNLLLTSSARADSGLTRDFAKVGHEALNEYGVTPAETAAWVLDALDAGRFWVLPPADDLFSTLLTTELDELREALAR